MTTPPNTPSGTATPEQPHRDEIPGEILKEVVAEHRAAAIADVPPIPPIPLSQMPRATFLRGFVFAWNGLVYSLRTQRNARVHAVIGAGAIVLGIVLHISPVEFALVFVAITLVFIAEMFNTVAEACVDLATSTYDPLARIAKDVAAGAVLVNAMLSVVIGLFVFGPHLLALAGHLFRR